MTSLIDLQALADMPGHGKAADAIRQHVDPLWGLVGRGRQRFDLRWWIWPLDAGGSITVYADNEEEARQIAARAIAKLKNVGWHEVHLDDDWADA